MYIMAPLKNTFLGLAHDVSHAFEKIQNSTHSHSHNHEIANHHEHKLISFFSIVFSSEKDATSSHDLQALQHFDKHLMQQDFALKILPKQNKKQIFHFALDSYTAFLKNTSPPPQATIS
ncbi:hypothetical protein BXY75_0267 [Ulvibacter antarcticus]|uniref:Uncharacterized protein n=2 Tax=Ulvibacter antarcticus TaxID=442714 RepID=A0A3L9YZ47_9FLAO|nr:hypothetical protein BXY75_0267 [Ulvibacter antarcticus]